MSETKAQQEAVQIAWAHVISMVNKILEADSLFGFTLIDRHINPSFDQMLISLGFIDAILNAMLATEKLEHDETRQALNAKQCVFHIQGMVVALREGDDARYEQAVKNLRNQSQF